MIPVVNIEFYFSWFLPVLPCLHSSVLCKNPVTYLYLAGVSPNFPIFFCIKSLMLNLTNYIQIHTPLCRVCLSIPTDSLSPCTRDSFHADKGPRGSAAVKVFTSFSLYFPQLCSSCFISQLDTTAAFFITSSDSALVSSTAADPLGPFVCVE